jgi:hypothetical protein
MGATHVRIFFNPTLLEPSDDFAPWGDGVASQAGFLARQIAMRAAEIQNTNFMDDSYVRWSYFIGNFQSAQGVTDLWRANYTFSQLRDLGVQV